MWGERDEKEALALEGWGPKEKSLAPKTDWEFTELEAAMAWGYTLGEWYREDLWVRQRAVIHVIERNTREAFTNDMHERKREREDDARQKAQAPNYEAFSQARARVAM